MTITVDVPSLSELTLDELREAWCASGGGLESAITAELDRREQAERRSASARAAAQRKRAEWEAAAYAQYLAADDYCHGNMLSAAGKRRGRDAWPMCWEGSDETARRLASDELITFWDYVQTRVPGPGAYAAAKRSAAAEHAARAEPATPAPTARPAAPSALELAERAASAPRPATRPRVAQLPPAKPGAIARYIGALGALQRQADKTARSLARVSGGIQR